jgi:hypothetical protein
MGEDAGRDPEGVVTPGRRIDARGRKRDSVVGEPDRQPERNVAPRTGQNLSRRGQRDTEREMSPDPIPVSRQRGKTFRRETDGPSSVIGHSLRRRSQPRVQEERRRHERGRPNA